MPFDRGAAAPTVVSGIGLRKTDMFGTPDPFVKISIDGESFSSKPMKKTLSPVWNQVGYCVLRLHRTLVATLCRSIFFFAHDNPCPLDQIVAA